MNLLQCVSGGNFFKHKFISVMLLLTYMELLQSHWHFEVWCQKGMDQRVSHKRKYRIFAVEQ